MGYRRGRRHPGNALAGVIAQPEELVHPGRDGGDFLLQPVRLRGIDRGEPTNGKYGEKIRDLAKNGRNKTTPEEEMNLFFEDRKEDVEINIKPNLKNKSIVIMDRYYFSSVAYQGARGLNPDYVEKKNEEIAPLPDVLIILDITPQITVKRIIATRKDGPNHFEQSKCLETVRELFNSQFAKRNYAKIIDGNGNHSAEEISKRIWDIVKPIIRDAEES